MACHTANMAFMALKLGHPTQGVGRGRRRQPRDVPELGPRHPIEFPARERHAAGHAALVRGEEGRQEAVLPPEELVEKAIARHEREAQEAAVDSGSILVGAKGIAYSPDDYGAEVFFSTGKVADGGSKPETCRSTTAATRAEERVGRGDQGGQAGDGLVELRLRRPADRAFLLGNVRRPHRQAVQLGRRGVPAADNKDAARSSAASTARAGT